MSPDASPIRRPDIADVEIEGEMVLFDEANRALHRLNPTASAIWLCLDGTGTLSEIATDLAEVFAAPPDQVMADVLTTVAMFEEQGLIEGSEAPTPTPEEPAEVDTDSPFVLEPRAPCLGASGPQFCLTVRAATHLLGLCCSTVELAEAARSVFKSALVEAIDPPGNLSIVATRARSGRPLLWCYRSTRLIGRHRGPRRAIQAVASLMSSYEPGPAGLTRLSALLLVRHGSAALLSSDAYRVAERLFPMLRRRGWQVHDAPWVWVDGASNKALVPPWTVDFDEAALADLPADPADLEPPRPGRYQVDAWIDFVAEGVDDATAAPGRVVRVAADAMDLASDPTGELRSVEALLKGTAWVTVHDYDASQVIKALEELTG